MTTGMTHVNEAVDVYLKITIIQWNKTYYSIAKNTTVTFNTVGFYQVVASCFF